MALSLDLAPALLAMAPVIVPAVHGVCRRLRHAVSSSSSASIVRARQEAIGTHLMRIEGYSRIDMMLPVGESIVSGKFHAGGHDWQLTYYPHGIGGIINPMVSANVSLVQGAFMTSSEVAKAALRVSILDRSGDPAFSCVVAPRVYRYPSCWGEGSPMGHLVTAKELRRSLPQLVDKDDCLHVRCDVAVLKVAMESRGMWWMRQLLKST
ncbi:hypothetical protein ACP70R_007720 [Stipagrostis hirtigluma subsp. patula]